MGSPTVSVIIPIYNEEEVLRESHRRLHETMESCGGSYELIFVNDGSRDRSAALLRELCAEDPHARALFFSRNFGHQAAVTAGMDAARGQAVVIIDADLQDPPELIPVMLDCWKKGSRVVYGRRVARKGETAFKKLTATVFYRVLAALSETKIPTDAGDFRLLDRAVCDAMCAMPEHNRYLRGMASWIGYEQTAVEYVREERLAGVSKYTLKKMLRLAQDGLLSFSYKPLTLALPLGAFLTGAAGAVLIILAILAALGRTVGPYLMGCAILAVLGVTQMMLGVVGLYLSRVCDEVRARPRYIVAERIGEE